MVVMVLAVALSPSGLLPSDRFRPTARSPPSPSAPSPAALSGPALPPPPALPGALPGALRGGVSSSNVPLHPLFPFFSSLLLLLRRRRQQQQQRAAQSSCYYRGLCTRVLPARKRGKMIILFSSLVFFTYPNRHNSIIHMYF